MHPETLKDYRPINLCNVLYKVVYKCLVNRLRPLLEGVISENQSAFIPRRLITDNALIAFECIHAIQQNNSANSKFCAVKLDLAKAYDHVDWNYLQHAMEKLGFHRNWVQWVMECVTTVRYRVRFNGVLPNPHAVYAKVIHCHHTYFFLWLMVCPSCCSKETGQGRYKDSECVAMH